MDKLFSKITALRKALSVPFDELERCSAYVTDNPRFATHQRIKGLEFPPVMVIMDDKEARGFLFSYEKLFGAKLNRYSSKKMSKKAKILVLCEQRVSFTHPCKPSCISLSSHAKRYKNCYTFYGIARYATA